MIDPRETDRAAQEATEVVIVTRDRPDKSPRVATATWARPRLGIAHLLIWVGCCGVFLGLARGMAGQPTGTLGALFLTLVAVGDGAAWAGLAITLGRTLRGTSWSIEPGQWLLALLGVIGAAEVLGEIASPRWLSNPQAVVEATATCAFVLPLFDKRLAYRWRWLFAGLAIGQALPLVARLVDQTDNASVLVRVTSPLSPRRLAVATAVAALLLALFDYFHLERAKQKEQRGWLHWTGIVTALWLSLLPLVTSWLMP